MVNHTRRSPRTVLGEIRVKARCHRPWQGKLGTQGKIAIASPTASQGIS